ncbi:hypothetical protein A0H81_05749 [Grifola frondosa]|uniref:Uncharacterized protein n=1 Tax=Grifola frondosa TaxID=5627 RepID=A0A1C7MBS5_GRIFR|nr:hypothetical protein A0H81_05749 [Grifola frondosa]
MWSLQKTYDMNDSLQGAIVIQNSCYRAISLERIPNRTQSIIDPVSYAFGYRRRALHGEAMAENCSSSSLGCWQYLMSPCLKEV